ncbi:MAG: hypothetical protein WAU58_08970 [Terriglobales bacterium]|jgi:hypothetical protein
MKTVQMIALTLVIGAFATSSLIFDRKILGIVAFVLLLGLVWMVRESRPWWLPSAMFAALGASHLVALWWLRSKGSASDPALETFGPGYLLMAAGYFLYRLWHRKTHV